MERSNVFQGRPARVHYDDFERIFEDAETPSFDSIPLLNRKIFLGHRVSIVEHPYVVSVRRLYSHYVTGTLLTHNLVLTVAHPLHLVSPCELGVVVGENYADRGTTLLTVLVVVIHERFDPYTLEGDIALIRLYEDINTRVSVKTISLISPNVQLEGLTGFVTGWGRCDRTGKELCLPRSSKYFRGERLDPMLRTIKFTLQSYPPQCDAYFTLSPGMLCMGPARKAEPLCPCMAVPGAPLVVNSRLAGLQSFGYGCGYANDLPLIYTNIQYYLRWLVVNIPILRSATKKDLTAIYTATKLTTYSEWLFKTRLSKPVFKKMPDMDIQPIDVDKILSTLQGTVYDIRNFIDGGKYNELKKELYKSMNRVTKKKDSFKKLMVMSGMEVKPFMSNDSLGDYGFVSNGSVYFNETTTVDDFNEKKTVNVNDDDDVSYTD